MRTEWCSRREAGDAAPARAMSFNVLAPPSERARARERERERECEADDAAADPPQPRAAGLLTPSKRACPGPDEPAAAVSASTAGAPRLVLPTAQRGGRPYSEFGVYFEGERPPGLGRRRGAPHAQPRWCLALQPV